MNLLHLIFVVDSLKRPSHACHFANQIEISDCQYCSKKGSLIIRGFSEYILCTNNTLNIGNEDDEIQVMLNDNF